MGSINAGSELPLADQPPLVSHSRVQMAIQAKSVAQVKGSQGSSRSVASVSPIAPLPQASSQVASDQTCISGVEDIVRQLAARMEVFFSQIQPTLIPPTSQSSMLLPGSSHPKHIRVPSQHK